jgi:uncharacterized protein
MAHRMYLYTTDKANRKSIVGAMLAEWNYSFPLLFQPLFSCKANVKNSDLYAEAKAGVAALERFLDFIQTHADTLIDRHEAWNAARQKMLAVMHEAAESPWFMLDASDVFGMSDAPFAEQAQELLADLDKNIAILEDAIAANNPDLLDDMSDLRASGFSRFRDWLNYEGYDYGWELLWASMKEYEQNDAPEIFEQNGFFGLRSVTGTLLCEPIYQEIFGFHDLTRLSVAKLTDGKFGFLDYQGQIAIPFVFDDVYDFYGDYQESQQRAFAAIKGLFGLIDRKGEWVAEPCWADLRYIYEDGRMLSARQGTLWAVLDRNGKVIVPPSLPGNATVNQEYNPSYYVCYDEDNKPLQHFSLKWKAFSLPKDCQVAEHYNPTSNIIIQHREGKSARYGLLSDQGDVLLDVVYDQLTYHEGFGLFVAKHNRKFGLYSHTDGWLLPCEYESIKHPHDDHIYTETKTDLLCVVRQSKRYGVYSYHKKAWVLPCEQGKIIYFAKHVLGIFHEGKTTDAGWWVHRCSDGEKLVGPYVSLSNLRNTLSFAAVLGFTKDAVFTIGQTGLCKPLTEQQADSLKNYLPKKHRITGTTYLDDAQTELIIKSSSKKKRGELLYFRAADLYDAKDYATALSLLHQSLDSGYFEAAALIGNIYDFADDYLDNTLALQWYRRAAEAGSLLGLNNYGVSLRDGDGVDADVPLAIKLLSQAMQGGYALAAKNLAEIYYNNPEYQDFDKALDCFLKAHREYPHPLEIAWLYDTQRKDYTNALKFYREAANNGEGFALLRMGEFWQYGSIGDANQDKAADFYRQAINATYPDPNAGLNLAELVIDSDPKAAKEAWQIAMDADIDPAKEFGKRQGWC